MPGRSYPATNPYRYGFNGKENDKEVNGQQDYGMRIYDARISRFKSIDPITKKYPELTPFQFASNRPIDGIDQDGLEYMKYIPKFEYTGSWTDYAAAIDNGVINILNIVPELWNSGVANYQSLARGTWTQDVGNEFKQMGIGIRDYAVNSWNYTVNTPIQQQFIDTWNGIKDPRTLEMVTTIVVGSKIKVPNANQIKSAFTVSEGMTLAEKMVVRSNFAKSFYESAGFSPAKAIEHMEGINFSKAVKTSVLKKGTVVQQWVGENGVGSYFTTLENGAAKNLGITYEGRTLRQFTLTEDVKVLESTAADYKGNAGGGTQYFSPELKGKVTETPKAP